METRELKDIQVALRALVKRWSAYSGTEKSGAQTFLSELVNAYTGKQINEAGARFEEFGSRDEGTGYMDLYWPEVCIIEMKAPKESRRLDVHRAQALDYWRNSSDSASDQAAPPFLVLCSFRQFEIWEPGRFPTGPRDSFTLEELPSRAEALLFLSGRTPVYGGPGAAVTEESAAHMVDLYFQLLERKAANSEELRRFIIQCVWTLFAEDLGLIPEHIFQNLIKALLLDPSRSSAIEVADLFRRFNYSDSERRNRGRQIPIPYVNGELFAEVPEVALTGSELTHLKLAASFDWQWVNPTVFGALMEGCLGHDRRWELGAHYTNEEDILSIVRPVIVYPWIEKIENLETADESLRLLAKFLKFKILDPAMGCSNFLAVAYREMRILEKTLHGRINDLHTSSGLIPPPVPLYPISNIQGIEIDPFAVEIAKATLWMTHALVARQYGAAEAPLPLQNFTQLICGDSLKIDWPETDVIIGNPPFHGDRRIRGVLGDNYISWLEQEFGIGVKDHCVYFFRKTHKHLKKGQRAGLVATNTISQAKNRDASLTWITENGGDIFFAISSQPWSGEAAVHVSIVCWEKGTKAPKHYLDGREVGGITPSLTSGLKHRKALSLKGNADIAYVGYFPNGMGFVLNAEEASNLLNRTGAKYADVVFPFINGDDLTSSPDQTPSRWIIDFGTRSLEEASKYPAALEIVRKRVKPIRDKVRRKAHRERWWQFAETRPGMTAALANLSRYPIIGLTGKRLIAVWGETGWRPSHACATFAVEDDYCFGVLNSSAHEIWARANGSTLEDRLRYTPSSCFETFPFPIAPTAKLRETVSTASREIVRQRKIACDKFNLGLTKVYNRMDEGGFDGLRKAHTALNRAVLDCYGMPKDIDKEDILDRLFDLNQKYAHTKNYLPFGTIAT